MCVCLRVCVSQGVWCKQVSILVSTIYIFVQQGFNLTNSDFQLDLDFEFWVSSYINNKQIQYVQTGMVALNVEQNILHNAATFLKHANISLTKYSMDQEAKSLKQQKIECKNFQISTYVMKP